MAYATSNPPMLISKGIGAASKRLWFYSSTDAATAVRVSGYFTDGYNRGMRAGDIIFSLKSDASPLSLQVHIVSASSSTAVDLSDGTAITGTNSD